MAPTFTANFTPCVVPLEIASNAFDPMLCFEISATSSNFSVSGIKILALIMAAGALSTDAVMRCLAKNNFPAASSPPKYPIYAASTPPAIVAIPPLIKHNNSLLVILEMYGFTNNGASV